MIPRIMNYIQMKHIVQVIVCALGIYLLRAGQLYQFTPSWRKDLDTGLYRNGKYPLVHELLPSPILTDLDGDGSPELVLITTDHKIQLCKVPNRESASGRLPQAQIVFTETLPDGADSDGIRGRPVVLETGFLDPLESGLVTRNQIIIVAYSNWFVVCYDHRLRVLWSQQLMDVGFLIDHFQVQSMAVLISPHKLHRGDRGMVIVGGNYKHKHDTGRHSSFTEQTSDSGSPLEDSDNTFLQLSVFALEAGNGTQRWYHLPSVQTQNKNHLDDSHHWKLSLHRTQWSHGGTHWSKFGSHLLKHFPHQWRDLKDSSFDIGDIRRDSQGNSEPGVLPSVPPSPLTELGILDDHITGKAFGGSKPHSRHEHIPNPTSVVFHGSTGLNVLSINTGQRITNLVLEDTSSVYGDIDDDGLLDSVRVNFAGSCQGQAARIHPRPKALFANSICSDNSWWSGKDLEGVNEDTHIKVAPVIVKSVALKRGLLTHLLGRALKSERKGYDSVFLNSLGLLSSYSPQGNLNWRSQTSARWAEKTILSENPHFRHSPEIMIYNEGFRPSMVPFSLQSYGRQTAVLVLGWNNMVLVSLVDGAILAEHSLPCQPPEKPVVLDFDNDGWNDVIVSCPSGYIGLAVVPAPRYVYMSVLTVTVFLSLLLLNWCTNMEWEDELK